MMKKVYLFWFMLSHDQFSTLLGDHYLGLNLYGNSTLKITVISLIGASTVYEKQFNNNEIPSDLHPIFINTKIIYDYIAQNWNDSNRLTIKSNEGKTEQCQVSLSSFEVIDEQQICRKVVFRLYKQTQQQHVDVCKQSTNIKEKSLPTKNKKQKISNQMLKKSQMNNLLNKAQQNFYCDRIVEKIVKKLTLNNKKIPPMKKTAYMCKKAIGLVRTGCSLRTIALQLRISQWNARKLKQEFHNTGTIQPQVAQQIYIGKSQGKSDIEMIKQMIIQILHSNPDCTINQMCVILKSKGIQRSGTSIRRYMQSLKLIGHLPKQNNRNIMMHYPQNCCLSVDGLMDHSKSP